MEIPGKIPLAPEITLGDDRRGETASARAATAATKLPNPFECLPASVDVLRPLGRCRDGGLQMRFHLQNLNFGATILCVSSPNLPNTAFSVRHLRLECYTSDSDRQFVISEIYW